MTETIDKLNPFRASKIASALGLTSSRNLYWFYKKSDGLNFGDWIGPYLFEKIAKRQPTYFDPRIRTLGSYISACGSILSHIRRPNSAIVWGSGAIKPGVNFAKPKKIHAVRGPLSRMICLDQGFDCPPVFGDPGILLPKYFNPVRLSETYPLGIVPHFTDLQIAKKLFADRDDILIIDVRRDVEAVVNDINACQAIISTSLHGMVIAQAYGIPVAWATMSDKIIGGSFKFNDYFLGVGLDYQTPLKIDISKPQPFSELVSATKGARRLDFAKQSDQLLSACPFL